MNALGIILTLAVVAGGFYFAYWAIKRTLADDAGKNRRQRRSSKR
ncbi:MAG: hypothetical protein R8P61_19540 [Bacteroidia bacterium]|nr:hypothetical protein [Bacteroidia bacterium]